LTQERISTPADLKIREISSHLVRCRILKNRWHGCTAESENIFSARDRRNYCFAKLNHLKTTSHLIRSISNSVNTALKTPADNSNVHERRSLISMRTVSFSPLPEAPCPFCMHLKCAKCREVSFSVAACCQCRKRALARLDCLQKRFSEGKPDEYEPSRSRKL